MCGKFNNKIEEKFKARKLHKSVSYALSRQLQNWRINFFRLTQMKRGEKKIYIFFRRPAGAGKFIVNHRS